MKIKRIISVLLLVAMLLSTLISCGLARRGQQGSVVFEDYTADVVAQGLATSSGIGDLRVMSFNVRSNSPAARQEALIREIQSYAPDLLGVQEDNYIWNTYLTEQLVTNGTYKRIYDGAVADGEYCSIYYNTELIQLVADQNGAYDPGGAKYLTHNGQKGAHALTWEEVPQTHRDALNMSQASDMKSVLGTWQMSYGVFKIKGTSKIFLYVNTHLQNRSQTSTIAKNVPEYLDLRERERKKEWDILEGHINGILKEYGDLPVFVTGDMNETMGSPSYEHITTNYDNASMLAEIFKGPDGTWNQGYAGDTGPVVSLQPRDRASTSTLDYCFLSKGDFTVKQYQVGDGRVLANGETDKYIYTSDHRPIIVDLVIGKEADDTPMTLELPGRETSAISYYSGTPDTSWYKGDPPQGQTTTYTLTTADQLMGFLKLRAERVQSLQVYTFKGVTIELGTNMVINRGTTEEILAADSKAIWEEMHSDNVFYGSFDGRGHYISGAYMEATDGEKGLLGTVGGTAQIKNLALVNSYLQTANRSGTNRMGVLASAIADDSWVAFYNLFTDAVVVEHPDYSFATVGGLVGEITSANTNVVFDHCTVSGSLKVRGSYVGGLVGKIGSDTASVTVMNCINMASVSGGNYTGGLIGYARAKKLNVNNCVSVGDVTALRMSGGLVGMLDSCPDFTVTNCVVNADLDFSGINLLDEDATKAGNQVTEGCQVGGLIGKTYNVTGYVTGCTIAGSMKGAADILTAYPDDSKTETQETNEYASGAIFGYNAGYTDNVAKTGFHKSYIAVDHLLVSIEMTDVESYLGGSRNLDIGSANSRISYMHIVYDSEKCQGMPLWGTRTDMDRKLDNSGELNNQIGNVYGFSTYAALTGEPLAKRVGTTTGNTLNYTPWQASFTSWNSVHGMPLVRTPKQAELLKKIVSLTDLWVLSECQTRISKSVSNSTDYRFVAAIRDADHQAYGFQVTISYVDGQGKRQICHEITYRNTIYKKIKGETSTGSVISYFASDFGAEYLATLVIQGVPNDTYNILVEIEAFAADKSGEMITTWDNNLSTSFVLNQK